MNMFYHVYSGVLLGHKNEDSLSFMTLSNQLRVIILIDVSHPSKYRGHMILFMWRLQKNDHRTYNYNGGCRGLTERGSRKDKADWY